MNTTIAIPDELKNELKEFGTKGEKYSDIIKKLVENAKKTQLRELLMNDADCIPIEQALEKAKKKWQK